MVADLMYQGLSDGENGDGWLDFDMQAASQNPTDEPVEDAIHRLENRLEFLSKKMRTTPLQDMYSDTKRLDHQMAAISNKLGYDQPDTKPRTVMEHVKHMGLKIEEVKTVLKADKIQKDQV